jgi:hypothetical protein
MALDQMAASKVVQSEKMEAESERPEAEVAMGLRTYF